MSSRISGMSKGEITALLVVIVVLVVDADVG